MPHQASFAFAYHQILVMTAGGLVMGLGILGMHFLAFRGWHIHGTVHWNAYGVAMTLLLGLGLSALSVNRANRPVTRWCRHGAATVLAFMVCAMHYALTASSNLVRDQSIALPDYLIPASVLTIAVVAAVLLVMGSRTLACCSSSSCRSGRLRPQCSLNPCAPELFPG